MNKRKAFSKIIKSILKSEGGNVKYKTTGEGICFEDINYFVKVRNTEYKITIFVDGTIHNDDADFDYIDSIWIGENKIMDFDFLYHNQLDPFCYRQKYDEKKIAEYFRNAYNVETAKN